MTDEMTKEWPRILKRTTSRLSPWVELVARDVEFSRGAQAEVYHSVSTADYVNVVALTRDGRIPIVRQYRPAIERFTLEIPAGLIDPGEQPAAAASRELAEETGFATIAIHPIGVYATDPGRLSNFTHSFFIEAGDQLASFRPEPNVGLQLVTPAELLDMIRSEAFCLQCHLGTLLQAIIGGHISLR
jgi:8-oxo-dGTP pyrophosphatase MutT (NUDIX family)